MLDFIGNGLGAGGRANPARNKSHLCTTANSFGQHYPPRQHNAFQTLSPTPSSYSQGLTASQSSGNSFSIGQGQPTSYSSQHQVNRDEYLYHRLYHQYVLDKSRTPQEPILSSLNSFFFNPFYINRTGLF